VGTTGPDGTLRTADATFQPFGRNCSEGGQQDATGGTVTYTTVTDTLVQGSYDLLFGKSRVQGDFSAPTCHKPSTRTASPDSGRRPDLRARTGRRCCSRGGGTGGAQVCAVASPLK
jgi:hypothetical protein